MPGVLSLQATIENVGIISPYSGDDNQNNTASVWYRITGTAAWLAGPELYADRSAREWRGSLIYLLSGTPYDVEVRFSDPDGMAPATVSGTVSTRPNYPDVGSGGRILYVPDNGSLQAVIQAAAPGDTIRLRAGTYYTTVLMNAQNSGTPGHYLTIEADPGAQVVIDGSDPDLNNPLANNWNLYQGTIYYTDLAWGDKVCSDSILPGYVGEQRGGDGVRYLLYYSNGATDWNDFLAARPGKAFYDCGGAHPGRLYVTTYDGDDPDQHVMSVSRYRYGLHLKGASYVRIRQLELRYYGLAGLQLGGPSADNNIVEKNTFHGIGHYHILIGGEWGIPFSADNLIQDNKFYERGYRDSGWTWEEMYHHANSNAIQTVYAQSGNVIRRNTIKGGTDGIDVGWESSDTDVYGNVIEEAMDDGLEVDNEPGYNIRVWGNLVRHFFSGISNQDWVRGNYWKAGPIYIFRNVLLGGLDPQGRTDHTGGMVGYDSWYAFKVGSAIPGNGRVYYYHNTVYIPDARVVGDGIDDAGGQYFSGIVARNNIWAVRARPFVLCCSTDTTGHDLDYDNLYHAGPAPSSRFIQWTASGGPEGNGAYRNLADFQRYVRQEIHAISNSNTRFNPDFSLQAGSPEIDAGIIITGINDHGPWGYQGQGPDIGAFEYSNVQGLYASAKTANTAVAQTGETVTFTIRVVRANLPLTALAMVTDTLRAGETYLTGTLTATFGMTQVVSQPTTIRWQGDMSDEQVAEIRYAVRIDADGRAALTNVAQIDEGYSQIISSTATLIVNGLPVFLPIVLHG